MDRNANCEYMSSLLNRNSSKKTNDVKKTLCSQRKFPRDRTRCPFTKPSQQKTNERRFKPQKCTEEDINWAHLLDNQKAANICGDPAFTLNDVDPRHVLNFLSNEIKLRLVKNPMVSNDSSLLRLVSSFQNIIEKLPAVSQSTTTEIATATEVPISHTDALAQKLSKCVQATLKANPVEKTEDETTDKKLTNDFDVLEDKYKKILSSLEKLQVEKIELERILHTKETDILFLGDQLSQLRKDKDEKYEPIIRKLQMDNKRLKSELKSMENIKRESEEQIAQKLNHIQSKKKESHENHLKIIEKLASQLTIVEQENRILKDQLNVMKLSEEKSQVILDAKNLELNEFKKDITLIKELTSRERNELQAFNNIFLSKNSTFNHNKLIQKETSMPIVIDKGIEVLDTDSETNYSFKDFEYDHNDE